VQNLDNLSTIIQSFKKGFNLNMLIDLSSLKHILTTSCFLYESNDKKTEKKESSL